MGKWKQDLSLLSFATTTITGKAIEFLFSPIFVTLIDVAKICHKFWKFANLLLVCLPPAGKRRLFLLSPLSSVGWDVTRKASFLLRGKRATFFSFRRSRMILFNSGWCHVIRRPSERSVGESERPLAVFPTAMFSPLIASEREKEEGFLFTRRWLLRFFSWQLERFLLSSPLRGWLTREIVFFKRQSSRVDDSLFSLIEASRKKRRRHFRERGSRERSRQQNWRRMRGNRCHYAASSWHPHPQMAWKKLPLNGDNSSANKGNRKNAVIFHGTCPSTSYALWGHPRNIIKQNVPEKRQKDRQVNIENAEETFV